MKNVATLTGLRGFAALSVAFGHLANSGLFFWVFEGSAKIGVWMFFILSAYLMTKLYLEKNPQEHMKHYALARIGRVLPLYYLIIIISLAFVGEDYWRYSFDNVEGFFLAFSLLSAPAELWAVPVEVQFYLLFALFWFFWAKVGGFSFLRTVVIFSSVLALAVSVTIWKMMQGLNISGLNLYIYIFMIGVMSGVYEDEIRKIYDFIRLKIGGAGLVAVTILLFLLSMPALRLPLGVHIPPRVDPIAIVASFLFFQLSLREEGIFRALAGKLFIFFGEVSYGFYLIHHLVITFALVRFSAVDPLILTPSILVISTILAFISYRLIERPANRYIRAMTIPALFRNPS